MKKRFAALLCAVLVLATLLSACGEGDPLAAFAIRHGSRDEKKVALTVDDSFDLEWTWKIRDLFREYGVVGTFFPIGKQIHQDDGEEWRKILEYGNEIGSHNYGHYKMGPSPIWTTISALGRTQQALDAALGYHYQIQVFRPPFGNITDAQGNGRNFRKAVEMFGYEHVILWDVSQTDPEKAIDKVQNGSILLYHARKKDHNCLEQLIPRLLEEGYELVTVSQLLGLGENETGEALYVYRKEDYGAGK